MPLDAAMLQLHVYFSTELPLDKKKAHRKMSNSFCRVKHSQLADAVNRPLETVTW